MKLWIRKLSSRKLWCALAGIATGLAMVLGADSAQLQAVAGGVTSLVSAVVYILTEGRIDAAATQKEEKL